MTRPDAIDRAIAAAERAVRARVDALVAERAAAMVLRPFEIAAALRLPPAWPVEGLSYGDLIARARAMLAQARHHPSWFITSDLVDFQAAARAVEIIAVDGDRLPAGRQARRAA